MSMSSPAEIVNNIPVIHDEIIKKYNKALLHSGRISGDVKHIYESIIRESVKCVQELENWMLKPESAGTEKINKHKIDDVIGTGDKKSIFACCAKDELHVLSAYLMVLSFDAIDMSIKKMLTNQQERIMSLYGHIKRFYNAQ